MAGMTVALEYLFSGTDLDKLGNLNKFTILNRFLYGLVRMHCHFASGQLHIHAFCIVIINFCNFQSKFPPNEISKSYSN